jgi:hypothetical protein
VTYFVKTDPSGEVVGIIRVGRLMEALTRSGSGRWESTGSLEWTGIGGDADWDAVGEDEALKAAAEMGYSTAQFRSGL